MATAANGFTSLAAVAPALVFHAVTAVGGVACVAKGRRLREASTAEHAEAA